MADLVADLQRATDHADDSPDHGENFEKLPEEKVQELRSLIQTFTAKRDVWARLVEIIRCTLRRYFWLGIQHGFWNADNQQMQIGPGGGSLHGENLNEEDLFQGDFNIYTQNAKIFIATFSQNAATTRIEPSDPGDAASIRAAEEADKYVRVYEKYNPPKVAQQEIGRLLWTDGRVVAVTEYAEDEENLGFDEDEEGNPVPRSTELTCYYGVLETKVPFIEPFSKWPYCKVSRELDKVTAQCDNPDFADKIGASAKGLAPNDEIARISRIATAENIAQVSSDTLAHMVTEDTWWLRPSAFYELSPEKRAFWIGGETKGEDGEKQQVEGIFPRGCRLKFFGNVFCGAQDKRMSDEVRVMHALPGNGNSRPTMSDALIPIQMEFNDAVGMYSEMIHKCIPRLWINAGPEEIAAILEQMSKYGEFSPFVKPDGQPMESNFFSEPTIDVPGTFPLWVDKLAGEWAQFVTGNMPALMGQSSEDQKTARGYQMMRDQALGIMALTWVPYIQFAAGIRGQAARCASKRNEEKISAVVSDAKGESSTLNVDVAALRGGFLCTPVTDQNFPESWTERANTWKALMAAAPANPVLAKNLQLPDNLAALKDAIGLRDFVIDGTDSRDLQIQEWAKMQEGQGPVVDQEATQARDQQKQQMAQQAVAALAPGQQPPPLPEEPPVMASTVPIDPETDDHVIHALEMFRILNSSEGQKIKETNPPAWQDGKLHLLAHVEAAKAKGLIIPPPLGAAPPMMPNAGKPSAATNPTLTGAPNALPPIPAV